MRDELNINDYNREAWNRKVDQQDRWTKPVSAAEVERARRGEFELYLTPSRPVPISWFPELEDRQVLCLASGGGQQGPLLAAAGATVTVLDNSPNQLQQDRFAAEQFGLQIATIERHMADLRCFNNESFDLIVHPCANCFVPELEPVWRESARVLRVGGLLLAGFTNPVRYLFDFQQMRQGDLQVRHQIPYSDIESLSQSERQESIIDAGEPLEFSHTLEGQIGGQIAAGFAITGFYEDRYADDASDPLSHFLPTFIATRATKTPSH